MVPYVQMQCFRFWTPKASEHQKHWRTLCSSQSTSRRSTCQWTNEKSDTLRFCTRSKSAKGLVSWQILSWRGAVQQLQVGDVIRDNTGDMLSATGGTTPSVGCLLAKVACQIGRMRKTLLFSNACSHCSPESCACRARPR